MEKAYIILAHKQPDQLYRLVERLDDGQSVFFIHIDKKASITDFEILLNFGEKVKIVKREDCKWGGISIVVAILNGMKAIKESNLKIERISLLSGQDYPIKSNDYINNFFKTSPYSIFIRYWEIPNYEIWKWRGGLFRLDKYFFGLKPYQRFISKTLNFLAILFSAFKRRMPYNLLPYGGWMWWTIDMDALNYILKFLEDHPKYLQYHKHTFVPDEIFFQTILLNSNDKKLLEKINNNDIRYIHWEKFTDSHPETLTKNSIKEITEADGLFARKFDIKVDSEILDLIDEIVLKKSQKFKENV